MDVEFQVSREDDDAPRWLGGRGKVIELAGDESPKTMVGVNWDITQRKRQEHSLALSAMEMDHRVKNSFAIMRALVSIGQRSATDLDSYAGKYILVVTTAKTYYRAGATRTAAAGVTSTDGYIPADTPTPFYVPPDGSRRYVAFMAGSGNTADLIAQLEELDTNPPKRSADNPEGRGELYRLTITLPMLLKDLLDDQEREMKRQRVPGANASVIVREALRDYFLAELKG